MKRSSITHARRLLGFSALALATSCAPRDTGRTITHRQPETDSRALLRGLALTVPADIAEHAPLEVSPGTTPIPPLSAAPPFVDMAQTPDDASRATECLTAAVYYEARSQSLDGQRAVAQVVLNRVRDRAFPNSICGVVYQGSSRRTGCQFSFTCDGSIYRPRDESAWDRARYVAAAALSGQVYAPVGSATYYHANSVSPWWAPSLTRIGSVGAHIFYRWRTGMEHALAFRQRYAGMEPAFGVHQAARPIDPVAVHYAQEVAGVTIHRGGGGIESAARTILVSGVRIHRGSGPARESPPTTGNAILSEEDGPI